MTTYIPLMFCPTLTKLFNEHNITVTPREETELAPFSVEFRAAAKDRSGKALLERIEEIVLDICDEGHKLGKPYDGISLTSGTNGFALGFDSRLTEAAFLLLLEIEALHENIKPPAP